MKTKRICRITAGLLAACTVAASLAACSENDIQWGGSEPLAPGDETAYVIPDDDRESGRAERRDMLSEVEREEDVIPSDDLTAQNPIVTDFALRLFRESAGDSKNALISPLSVLYALSMTANGAEGETLSQMETVLGMTKEELNLYLYSYMSALPSDGDGVLNLANSIWFNADSRFTANEDFLKTAVKYYDSDIYEAEFDDITCTEINDWVSYHTDGMIPSILDNIPDGAVMYLINALSFEADWATPYLEYQVWEDVFTREDGTEQKTDFMHDDDFFNYIEDENAVGFIKYYSGRDYAFAALLPDEGISLSDYIASLDGERLSAMLSGAEMAYVSTSIPKFETEYSVNMSKILSDMGMPIAFDESAADFSSLGTSEAGNIFISRVLHKTYISVYESGTTAAATLVEASDEGAIEVPEVKEVHLDRPFVYMLIDCENNIPLFIGAMESV